MPDPLARGGRKAVLRGRKAAKRRGIVRYRVVRVKPGVYVRVAVVRRRGPRGGRTVATSIVRRR